MKHEIIRVMSIHREKALARTSADIRSCTRPWLRESVNRSLSIRNSLESLRWITYNTLRLQKQGIHCVNVRGETDIRRLEKSSPLDLFRA